MRRTTWLIALLLCHAMNLGVREAAAQRLSALPLKVGSASVAFVSDDSLVIAGGIGPGGAKGQEGELRATATVIEDPKGNRVAIVACDILMMRRDYFDAAAERVEREVGIPSRHVLMNATHTHHAPSTVTIHDYQRDEGFCAQVRDKIVDAVRQAAERAAAPDGACEFLFRLSEESSVGQNSRLLLPDGTIHWVGPWKNAVRPTGPFDPELPVLAFRRRDGSFASVIFNHSTHAIGTVKPGVRSPSFYGLAAQELEHELGSKVTFISGAYGSTHNLTLGCAEMVYRIQAAVRAGLSTLEPRQVDAVRGLRRELTFRVRHFDEEAEEKAVSYYCGKRFKDDYTAGVFRKMRRELTPHQGEERKTWVQVLVIGDVAFVGVPGEFFTSLGIEIKRRSPFRYTYIAGTANDYIGYLGDAEAYALGGYQVWTGFHSFVERGTGERIVEVALEMLKELGAAQ